MEGLGAGSGEAARRRPGAKACKGRHGSSLRCPTAWRDKTCALMFIGRSVHERCTSEKRKYAEADCPSSFDGALTARLRDGQPTPTLLDGPTQSARIA
jgi:hypothetical protein